MKVLDRVKLIEPHKLSNGIIISKDTVGTIRAINEHNITIQAGINPYYRVQSRGMKRLPVENISQLFTVSDLILEPVTVDELKRIDYRYITPKIFHPGNMWSVRVDYDENSDPIYKSGIIEEYFLALSEDDDAVTLTFLEDIYNNCKNNGDLQAHKYLIRYLNTFGSYSVIIE